jgi:hypothetical protein
MKLSSTIAAISLLLPGVAMAQNTNSAALDVHDGFDGPYLSELWDTTRFAPGAVLMQSEVVRAGQGSAKVTVHAGEKLEVGANGNKDSERAELMEARKLVSKEGNIYEYSFSEFIPTNFPIVPTRLVLAQWKQFCPDGGQCWDDSPVVALRYASGVLKINHQTGEEKTTLFQTKEELRGKWLDFKFQMRFTTNANGFVKGWLNGKQVVDYHGVNAYSETGTGYPSPSYFYFKMGLYRDVMAEPMSIYIDEYRKKRLPDESK